MVDISDYGEKYQIEIDSRFYDAFIVFTEKFAAVDNATQSTRQFTTSDIFHAISAHLPFCGDPYENILVELMFDYGYKYDIGNTFTLEYKWMVQEQL